MAVSETISDCDIRLMRGERKMEWDVVWVPKCRLKNICLFVLFLNDIKKILNFIPQILGPRTSGSLNHLSCRYVLINIMIFGKLCRQI